MAVLSCAFEAEQALAVCHLQVLRDRASARMSASTAIQLQFIQYCVVEIVEITEIVDIGEYRVKDNLTKCEGTSFPPELDWVKEAIRNRV